jgi:hypothetical protein
MTSSLTRDFTATPTNAKKFTISFWLKKVRLGSNQIMLTNYGNSGNDDFQVQLRNDDTIGILDYKGASVNANHETTRKFQDTTSWYHIVVAGDSTQSTAANRLRLYVNGLEETSWASLTSITQDADWNWNKEQGGTSVGHVIGTAGNGTNIFHGYLAHIHNVDGTAYAPTTFGETDSTTGEWKPILNPSVTYGNNGWFLKFENAGALGTDSSGNSATFTVSGDLKQSVSTPSNTFATLDANQAYDKSHVRYASTAFLGTSGSARGCNSTFMMNDGKWYVEFKPASASTSADNTTISLIKNGTFANIRWKNEGTSAIPGKETGSNGSEAISYQPMTSTPNLIDDGGGGTVNYGSQASANDIIMMAVDLSAATSKIWFGKNGTWFNAPGTSNAGDPANGNYAGLSFTKGDDFWGIGVTTVASGGNQYIYVNFGEGRFGTTAVSSANADGASLGAFEYAVPSGFYSICTKNIKTYG